MDNRKIMPKIPPNRFPKNKLVIHIDKALHMTGFYRFAVVICTLAYFNFWYEIEY